MLTVVQGSLLVNERRKKKKKRKQENVKRKQKRIKKFFPLNKEKIAQELQEYIQTYTAVIFTHCYCSNYLREFGRTLRLAFVMHLREADVNHFLRNSM